MAVGKEHVQMSGDGRSVVDLIQPEHHAKDHAGKYLEEYPDVFADIFNVLVFRKVLIDPKNLLQGPTESIYKAENGRSFREQRRDTTKYVQDLGTIISLVGIDNQTDQDEDMVIRVMGYDYASYRNQISTGSNRYPIITAVLYFGDKKWSKKKTLKELFNKENEEFAIYAQNYKMHLIDVAHIPKKMRKNLTSDFREVADFFANRKNKSYRPSRRKLNHVEAVLKMLEVFTGDKRYQEIEDEIIEAVEKGDEISMCEFAERMTREGISQGISKGINQEKEHGIAALVESLREYNIPEGSIIETVVKRYAIPKTAVKKYL
ncbi:MAG: Rpn family recombination-promoting nuclease/putative transposase [Hespellia sp.]|nr:Rpn family recombination-promoting nuclease/putative transposase [Hespellia sp.]